jgi:deoxycytidylate deaminase
MAVSTNAAPRDLAAALTTTSDHPVEAVSPLSKELVIGLVGYAGAGCSTAARRLRALLEVAGYTVHRIQLSRLIHQKIRNVDAPAVAEGPQEGIERFDRAATLQDLGDQLRHDFGTHAVATLGVKEIIRLRGGSDHGAERIAFLLDSLKHRDEVNLLRRVYDLSFRLVAVHCERTTREGRLIGSPTSVSKYRGVPKKDVIRYMDRDEKDVGSQHGQQVRDAFYLADYFIDNNVPSQEGQRLNANLQRFIDLLLGNNLVRPADAERGIFHAHAAALQSACLSRQVGSALFSPDGRLISTGTNDVPRFGGGIYSEDTSPDNRCFQWEFKEGDLIFSGCHNTRRKNMLKREISRWLADEFSERIALAAHPKPAEGSDTAAAARAKAVQAIRSVFTNEADLVEQMPGVGDLIEYSRSIHAEMNAILNAARSGAVPIGCTLYCTTFPCHSCARHLVSAGVSRVYYIEPYVKSLAAELHMDSIQTVLPGVDPGSGRPRDLSKMVVVPFTGVGPRMYEDYFLKRDEMKEKSGKYKPPAGDVPAFAVRLRESAAVEAAAASLIPD